MVFSFLYLVFKDSTFEDSITVSQFTNSEQEIGGSEQGDSNAFFVFLMIQINDEHADRLLVWRIGEEHDKLLLDEDLWERFGWTTATKVTSETNLSNLRIPFRCAGTSKVHIKKSVPHTPPSLFLCDIWEKKTGRFITRRQIGDSPNSFFVVEIFSFKCDVLIPCSDKDF